MKRHGVVTVSVLLLTCVLFSLPAFSQPVSNSEKECTQSLKQTETHPNRSKTNSTLDFIDKTLSLTHSEVSEIRIARLHDLVTEPDTTPKDLAYLLAKIFDRQINQSRPTAEFLQVRSIAYVRLFSILPEPHDYLKISLSVEDYLLLIKTLLNEAVISDRPQDDVSQLEFFQKSAIKLLPPS